MNSTLARLHTEFFGVEQLAALLGVATSKINRILNSGRVRTQTIEGKPYLHHDQLPDLQQALDES